MKLKDSYGKADTSVYQDSVDLSKNIQAINYDIVKRTGISDGEANSKSRKLTDINMRTYSDIKANAK